MKSSILARALGTVVLAIVVSACASLGGLDSAPRITLAGLRPAEIGLLEQRYAATLRIQNPNRTDIGIEGLDCFLEINGRDFARGLSDRELTVPAFGERTVELSVLSTLPRLLEQLTAMQGSTIRYRLSGRAALKGIANTVPFSHEGEIALEVFRAGDKRA